MPQDFLSIEMLRFVDNVEVKLQLNLCCWGGEWVWVRAVLWVRALLWVRAVQRATFRVLRRWESIFFRNVGN